MAHPRHARAVASTWRSDLDATAPAPTSPGAPPALRPADDPELARVRLALFELRPDCPDPMEPPRPDGPASALLPRPSTPDPNAWGGVPRGAFAPAALRAALVTRTAADVLGELAALAPEHGDTLRWLRLHGSVARGLRALYVDAGLAAALRGNAPAGTLARWNASLAARRDGAYFHGRKVLLAALAAWGR